MRLGSQGGRKIDSSNKEKSGVVIEREEEGGKGRFKIGGSGRKEICLYNDNLLIQGDTRSGKTSTLVAQNIINWADRCLL